MGFFGKNKGKQVTSKMFDGDADGGVDAPWVRAGMAYNDTFLRLAKQAANWRLFAFFSIFVAAICIVGVIYIGSRSKYVPMIVEVDKLGRTLAIKPLHEDGDPAIEAKTLVYRELFDLIENLRSVTTDIGANNNNLTKGFSRLTDRATIYVRTQLRAAPPNEVGTRKTVQVQVKTALPLSKNTWQVEWEEWSYNMKGENIGVDKWKATVTYKISPPTSEKGIRINPIGFYVTDINWMKVI
jgi:type IV secretion system protein VirB5